MKSVSIPLWSVKPATFGHLYSSIAGRYRLAVTIYLLLRSYCNLSNFSFICVACKASASAKWRYILATSVSLIVDAKD